jgi:hypothetical protein
LDWKKGRLEETGLGGMGETEQGSKGARGKGRKGETGYVYFMKKKAQRSKIIFEFPLGQILYSYTDASAEEP